MKNKPEQQHIVGKTKDVGFQIGVRKTFALAPQQAWDLISSQEGLKIWLGDVADFRFEQGYRYQTRDGVEGEVRVVNPGGHVRLTWQPQDWQRASTIQVRVIPSGSKTVIAFHQEQLASGREREQMHQRWERVLAEFQGLIKVEVQ